MCKLKHMQQNINNVIDMVLDTDFKFKNMYIHDTGFSVDFESEEFNPDDQNDFLKGVIDVIDDLILKDLDVDRYGGYSDVKAYYVIKMEFETKSE